MNEYIVKFWPSERVILIKYANSAREAWEKAEKEAAPGETVYMSRLNKKGSKLEAVHEVFHD